MGGRKLMILIVSALVLSGCKAKTEETVIVEENQTVQHHPVVIRQEGDEIGLYELAVSRLGYSKEEKSWGAGDGETLSGVLPEAAGELPCISQGSDFAVEFPETVEFYYMRVFDEQYEKVISHFADEDAENEGETPSEFCVNSLKQLPRGDYYVAIAVVEDGRYVESEGKNESAVYEYCFRLEGENGQDFSFADVADREFYFSSGAGGWYTVLHIHGDGSFDGHYQDSDMGDVGDGYPNGTIYYSDFSGVFTEPVRMDDTTYVFQIDSIEYPCGFGEEIKDGCYYRYSEAYGLDGAEDLYLYLPGAKLEELPEEYRSWVGYYDLENVPETELPFYGLYNAERETGFSSCSYRALEAEEQVRAEVGKAEVRAADLKDKLQAAQSQIELNEISGELYKMWDETLNSIWGILKESLDEKAMQILTKNERAWIAEKEAAVEEAGKAFEGGSMEVLEMNMKAADLTRDRVYDLMGYLQ